ncbi:MAG TPA: carboxypeptidase regulatory-like domain-containing protein [Bryobacterales bacterium]|nr:carboxypeptidase regulatory-like domain-containing protein [Bryobacterales bacterium]
MLISMALLAVPLAAQLTRGFISGTVQDPTGAVVPGVRITITNRDTGFKAETATNGVGVYRFVAVEPGVYTVEFSKSGFETKQVVNVHLAATQEAVLNTKLDVASAATTVEVVETPLGVELAKSSAVVERKLDQRFVENVALTGGTRDVNQLALLAPTANRAPGSTQIAVNGQRARNNNFLLDGVDNNDLSVTLVSNRIIPEAVEEFQTQVQAYSAEFGRNTGAQIQAITRGGTNDFHGEVYDYIRGNWTDPVSLPNKRQGLTATPRYDQNQAGGDVGGPIIKNRTFFFALLEANRRREAPSANNATSVTVPTSDGFAALSGVPLGPNQATDSRQTMLNGLGFLKDTYPLIGRYTNLRNVSVNGVPIQVGTINIPLANPYDFWYLTDRVDHQISDRDRLTYRLQIDKRNQPDFVSNVEFGNRFAAAQTILGQNHALSETHTFGAHFVNEFRFAFVRRNLDFPENDPVTPSTAISGFFDIGGLSNYPQGRIQNTFQWQNVSTVLAGRHSLKFGADIRRNRLFNLAAFDSKGTFTFDNFQDFINNQPATFRQAINTSTFDARQTNQYYFFQDDFKVSRDFTLNIGVRYETSGSPFGFFGATDPKSLAVGVPGPVKRDNNNWAPRLGLAWSPSASSGFLGKLLGQGQTVFRGGFGMAYDVLFYNILTVNASNYPRVVVNQLDRAQLGNVWPHLLPPAGSVAPPFDPRATWVNSPVDTQNPTTNFYNFSIQRQFATNYIFEIAYTGSRSYHGIRQGNTNPGILTPAQAAMVRQTKNASSIPGLPGLTLPANNPPSRRLNPDWGSRVTIESTALAGYNAMYVKLDKRFSRGLVIGGNYTWSKNMSDNDESLGVSAITNWSSQVPQDFFNYRSEWSPSAFDVTQRFAIYYSYDVPWFSAPGLNRAVVKQIFQGWTLSGFTDYQSGQPFTIRTGVDTYGTGSASARPFYNPGGTIAFDPVTGNYRTFTTPVSGAGIVTSFLGSNGVPLANTATFPAGPANLGRNTFRGPGTELYNITAAKTFNVTERWRIRLRADWINAFNHRNFGNPVATMNSPIFGQNTLVDPGGRTMLLSAKVSF